MLIQDYKVKSKRSEQIMPNISKLYYDYSYNWFNFALRYNRAFLDAALESYKSFISEDRKQIDSRKIRNRMRASFDSTLRQRLCEKDVGSNLANFIDSWLNIVKISGYDKYGSFPELLSFRSKLFEPSQVALKRLRSSADHQFFKLPAPSNLLP